MLNILCELGQPTAMEAITMKVVVFHRWGRMGWFDCHGNNVCLFHAWVKAQAQRWALFCPDHPSTGARRLRIWLYFMSPNCAWPGLLRASFQLGKEAEGGLPADWGISADQRGCLLTSTFAGRSGTRLKFILPLGGMELSLPPPVRWGRHLPSPLAL